MPLMCAAQYFEGVVLYENTSVDGLGTKQMIPVEQELVTLAGDKMLFKPTKGMAVSIVNEVLLDVAAKAVFEIDHNAKKIYQLAPMERDVHLMKYVETQKDTFLLGRKCIVKVFKQYDVHFLDTAQITYWLAPSLQINKVADFAQLQGNRNTLLVDGSLEYLPLMIRIRFNTGRQIIKKALNIAEKHHLKSELALPNYSRELK
jgi:hypothetical protein